jgi:hypothetical protein
MEDDPEVPAKSYPLTPSKMSKTPSWIMLGFLLGALTVIALPPLRKSPPATAIEITRTESPEKRSGPVEPPQLMTIEAVFAQWGQHAVWFDGTAEVALWNSQRQSYSDFFEVRRFGSSYYFRTIPELTRRVIKRGKPMPDSPLEFTETEEQYQEWRQHGRSERPREYEPRPPLRFTAPEAPPVQIVRPSVEPPAGQRMVPFFDTTPASNEKKDR